MSVFSLKQLAELTDSKVNGDENTLINAAATLQEASEGQISFVSNPKYKKYLKDNTASAVILSPALAEGYSGNVLINSDPYLTFAKVLALLHKPAEPVGSIHASAVISDSAEIGLRVEIGANAVIQSGVTIGDDVIIGAGCVVGENCSLANKVILHANVTLYSGTTIESGSIIHSGVVIGADGFGFAPQKDKSWYKILQVGNVVIGNNVEVGACTTIDRAALGSTIISDGVKLDNQIQVGHNVVIGKDTIIAGGTVFAGSSVIGERCQIGGAVAIAGHLTIADDVVITGKSMVIKSISRPGVYSSGVAADENRKWRRNAARFRQLDDMAKKLRHLEQELEDKNKD